MGCHFLLQCMKVKCEREVAQSCPTLSDPMDCSPPGSSVHGIFQARGLEWGAVAFSGPYIYIYIYLKICLKIFGSLMYLEEKAMATHSSTLAWRIPGTGEPGLQPHGLHPWGCKELDMRLKRLNMHTQIQESVGFYTAVFLRF